MLNMCSHSVSLLGKCDVFYKKNMEKIDLILFSFRLPGKNLMCSARKFLKIFTLFPFLGFLANIGGFF